MVLKGFSWPSTVLVSSALNNSENAMGTAFAPRVLKLFRYTLFCITRSLMPSKSSTLLIARLLLVRLRKPFSQYTSPTRPLSCNLLRILSPTGPSNMASASLVLLIKKGASHSAISLVMPTRVAVEPTIIS